MFTVRCPKCQHDQLYQPQKGFITEKSKRCVYCGSTFKIHSNMKRSRIVCEGKREEFNTPLF